MLFLTRYTFQWRIPAGNVWLSLKFQSPNISFSSFPKLVLPLLYSLDVVFEILVASDPTKTTLWWLPDYFFCLESIFLCIGSLARPTCSPLFFPPAHATCCQCLQKWANILSCLSWRRIKKGYERAFFFPYLFLMTQCSKRCVCIKKIAIIYCVTN